jgi:hypothetical protein
MATNTIELERNRSEINETDRYSPAHNGLVAGSSHAGLASLRSRREQGCRAEAHRANAGYPRELAS